MNVHRASEPLDPEASSQLSDLSSAFLDNTRRGMLLKLKEIDDLVQVGKGGDIGARNSINEKYAGLLEFIQRFRSEILG